MGSSRQRKTARRNTIPPAGVRHYTLSEAAQVLGVHYETAARWVRTGKLRGVKLSRRKVLVPRQGCEALLSGSGSRPGSGAPLGSLARWLPLMGTLTPEEGKLLRHTVEDRFEKIGDLG